MHLDNNRIFIKKYAAVHLFTYFSFPHKQTETLSYGHAKHNYMSQVFMDYSIFVNSFAIILEIFLILNYYLSFILYINIKGVHLHKITSEPAWHCPNLSKNSIKRKITKKIAIKKYKKFKNHCKNSE